jgi:hypothetical protein
MLKNQGRKYLLHILNYKASDYIIVTLKVYNAKDRSYKERSGNLKMEEKKTEATKTENKPKKSNKGLIALIVAVVIATCGFGGWQYHQNQIKEMRDAGIAELKASVNLDDYREAEQKEINAILDEGEKAILATEEEAEVDKVIEDAAGKVSELKTDAQYTKEEEEEAARQAELERQRQEEEAAAAAAAARSSSSKSSGGGCVGGGSSAFY